MELEKPSPKPIEKSDQKNFSESIDQLIGSVEKLTAIQSKIEKQNRLGPTIIRATAYALGSTLGLAIVVSIIFYVLKSLGLFSNLTEILNNAKDLKNLYQ